jgi:hypothetical protein
MRRDKRAAERERSKESEVCVHEWMNQNDKQQQNKRGEEQREIRLVCSAQHQDE